MQEENKTTGKATISCTHCGEKHFAENTPVAEPWFCCEGCKMVFNLLSEHNLEHYYQSDDLLFVGRKPRVNIDYSFLDNKDILDRLIQFSSEECQTFNFELPDIHCTACIWLLENLERLTPGILYSRVNFLKKTCSVGFDPRITQLRTLAEVLHRIGYTPRFNQDQLEGQSESKLDRSIYFKIGVAGFCFGNIMLLSFPDYLGLNGAQNFAMLGYINIALALPVMFYSGVEYLRSAIWGLRVGNLGIDVPIALGMIVLFTRSIYEILSFTGGGYLDSLSGFVFFLLIGKWFQKFSQQSISFDRDFRSFFPISVLRKDKKEWSNQNVRLIKKGDLIKIRHKEIIPCDGILLSPSAKIDYSFVTGEEKNQLLSQGERLYAGGRLQGTAINLKVTKQVDQSYLTRLWNEDIFSKERGVSSSSIIERIGHHFVLFILVIAIVTAVYWLNTDPDKAFNAITAVLIIACPCVLALSVPFIYGNMLRLLAKQQVFCRNTNVLEQMHMVDTIVFDKTGTLTDTSTLEPYYVGKVLNLKQRAIVKSLAAQSTHPLSQAIFHFYDDVDVADTEHFEEAVGRGIEARIDGHKVRLGAPGYIFDTQESTEETVVLVEIDDRYYGRFLFRQKLRKNIAQTLNELSSTKNLYLLTGDGHHDDHRMKTLFPESAGLHFNQKPLDKLNFIRMKQAAGSRVMMIGDGLNDAGALKQSDVGIVVSQSNNNFTPACDMIISKNAFEQLSTILLLISRGRVLLYGAFVWAFIYNFVGLYLAVTAQLSPVVAAILMPVSSITIMLYGFLSTNWIFRRF